MKSGNTILIVDDDKNLLFLYEEILAGEGYKIITAATGFEAVEALEGHNVDLVIIDLNLPDIDGAALMYKIKHQHPLIKIVIITGHGDVALYIKATESRTADYLVKPVDIKTLRSVLKNALANSNI